MAGRAYGNQPAGVWELIMDEGDLNDGGNAYATVNHAGGYMGFAYAYTNGDETSVGGTLEENILGTWYNVKQNDGGTNTIVIGGGVLTADATGVFPTHGGGGEGFSTLPAGEYRVRVNTQGTTGGGTAYSLWYKGGGHTA